MADIEANPFISFRSVCKSYGGLHVLKNLDLTIRQHEHVVLIGPSGSGKSTILRVLMTLESIQKGNVLVGDGHLWRDTGDGASMPPPRELNAIRRKIGMVFQSFNLFPHMTVLRNVAEAPVRVLKISRAEANERARKLLLSVGLAEKEDCYPIQLSGGQQQRVAIARCLAMRPEILLFDEVTSALDPETVSEVLNVIRSLASEHKFTILMVTHQMDVAREIGNRVVFLERGRIIEEGSPNQVLDNPRNDRTRSFLRAVLQA
ncbi:amino acid ABC transporter ATP-binding protein (PAAT family) [Bradyrhizobium macuxiense]|uniref:Amino acid ABC transporter ATP-binding protein (PAAT family) n=1 Tax=Bradyrhizobium macuxiense TaxID=1755647 RepID=A0A560KRX4_9BRAD|nr:ectoine/hydroxyectoine ABC transporter ATP-binding protein EhuA [Bradyrhizobium macuxiense]TWB86018.1 amino acid ABC transporter ATP-binding protein (PAAT family) [Bradyrhizobium macuxiense]